MTKARWRFIGGTIGPERGGFGGGGAVRQGARDAPDIGMRDGEKKTKI